MITSSKQFCCFSPCSRQSEKAIVLYFFHDFLTIIGAGGPGISRLLAQPPERPNPGDQDPGERQGDGSACGQRGSGRFPGSWFPRFGLRGGCASSRLDHGLKFYVIWGGCASSRLINGSSDCAKSAFSTASPIRVTRPKDFEILFFIMFFQRSSGFGVPLLV